MPVLNLGQYGLLAVWIESHREELKESTRLAAARRATEELGFKVAYDTLKKMAEGMSVIFSKENNRVKNLGSNDTARNSASRKIRYLARTLECLHEKLGHETPVVLRILARGRRMPEDVRKQGNEAP
jgi:hypothetical protein